MVAKYMPSLKKVSVIRVFGAGLAPKRFLTSFKFRSSGRLRTFPINGSNILGEKGDRPVFLQKMRCLLWNYVFGHFKRCGIE
jgi:hypothetical protein